MIFDEDRSYTCRRTGEDDVARLECEELANETYQFVHSENHVGSATCLYLFSITKQVEL